MFAKLKFEETIRVNEKHKAGENAMKIETKSKISAYLGSTIGMLGWLIGLTITCLITGNMEALKKVFYLGFVISLSMGVLFIVMMELVTRLYGRGRLFMLTLWGALLFNVGILILLFQYWVGPTMMKQVVPVADQGRWSWTNPSVSLTVGLILLIIAAVNIIRKK